MAKKDIDWSNLGFGYVKTDKRFVANYKNGAWDNGVITDDDKVVISECAGVLQYSQSCFEGMKAYTTENGHTVIFRPDMNASRMADSCRRLEMPVFPEDKFVEAIAETVRANEDWVPPYGSGASLYIRPYMFGSNPVIGVKPADEYQFRVFTTPVGPYFKGGAKPLTIKVSDFDRAAPHGTGHIKAGLNYAMSLHAATIYLCVVSILLTLIISLPLGIIAAVNKNRCIDYIIRLLSFLGNSMPNFFAAIMLIYIFALKLNLLPVMGMNAGIKSVILPAVTLAIAMSSRYIRQIRTAVINELQKDYVQGAIARGVGRLKIITGSVLKSSLLTIITLLALSIGSLLGGTAIVESIFMWDGVGKMAIDAITMRDYPVIQAYVIWMAIIYVVINLITDIVYHYLNPRIRLGDCYED